MDLNSITEDIIGAAIEVHKILGPGLLESAYEECLCREFTLRKMQYSRQYEIPVKYKGMDLDCGYRMDLLVENGVIVELKSVEKLMPIHSSQLLSYLKLSKRSAGLLINFNVPVLKQGIRRKVLNYNDQ